MTFGKLLITGLAVASLTTPAISAVRPSVKPVVVSAQKGVTPAVHSAGRAGAELKEGNEFLPFFGGGLFGIFASSAVTFAGFAGLNQIVRLPLLNDLFEGIGVGNPDTPSSPGS